MGWSAAEAGPRRALSRAAGRASGLGAALAVSTALVAAPAAGQDAGQGAPAATAPTAAAATAATTPAATPATAQRSAARWAEYEALGLRVGTVTVRNQPIFDTSDPRENLALFRLANRLHVPTRAAVIERALLFAPGQPLSARVIAETERLLRGLVYLYEVRIQPLAVHDGVVDIEVMTRDAWTLDLGVSAGRSGGSTSSGVHVSDQNLGGSGITASVSHSRTVDRSGTELALAQDRVMGSPWSLALSHARNDDGQRSALALQQPFYGLDARGAGGISLSQEDRIDSRYAAGTVVAEYRHRVDKGQVWVGQSEGLRAGWAQRLRAGLLWQDDRFGLEPGRLAPLALPEDDRVVAPFLAIDWLQDRWREQVNHDLVARPEYFLAGSTLSVQLGAATPALGARHGAALWQLQAAHGAEPRPGHTLLATLSADGRLAAGELRRQALGAQLQYWWPLAPRWLAWGSLATDRLLNPGADQQLMLGGDNGLRGWPLRYQGGSQRVLASAEARYYTDWYLWRLLRFGAAGFVDVGRAWGGLQSTDDWVAAGRADGRTGWLADFGMGLRIVSERSAFGNVLHLDVAVPVNAPAGVRRVQVGLKSKLKF